MLRCLAGSLLPGGNDGLVLFGMRLLWAYAWASFATMLSVVTVGLGLGVAARLR